MSKPEIRLSEIDLNLLVALDALFDEQSVTRAAQRMGVTQSAMSHTLRRLRALFGDKLLVRGHAGMVLTPRAEALRGPVRTGLAQLQCALTTGSTFDPETAVRTFEIGATDFTQVVFLPRLLSIFATDAPGASVYSHTYWKSSYAERLEEGSMDAVVGVDLPEHPNVICRVLSTETFACAVRRDHPAVGDELDLDTYLELPHILISPTGHGLGPVDTKLAAVGKSRRVAARVSAFLVAPLIAGSSDYVLTAPRRLLEVSGAPIRIMPVPIELPPFKVRLAWHERYERDPTNQWLRQAIVRACSAPET